MTLFVEGEEEYRLADPGRTVAQQHRDMLTADVIVIADSGNWDVGEPALTTSLARPGRTPSSRCAPWTTRSTRGMFGGAVPDALTTLCRLLATLHDDRGRRRGRGSGAPARPRRWTIRMDRFRAEAGLLDGVDR